MGNERLNAYKSHLSRGVVQSLSNDVSRNINNLQSTDPSLQKHGTLSPKHPSCGKGVRGSKHDDGGKKRFGKAEKPLFFSKKEVKRHIPSAIFAVGTSSSYKQPHLFLSKKTPSEFVRLATISFIAT